MSDRMIGDWLEAEPNDEEYTDYGLQCPNCQEYATELIGCDITRNDNRWRCSWCKSEFDEAQSSGRYNRSHQYRTKRTRRRAALRGAARTRGHDMTKRHEPTKQEQIDRALTILRNHGRIQERYSGYTIYNQTEERQLREYVFNALFHAGLIEHIHTGGSLDYNSGAVNTYDVYAWTGRQQPNEPHEDER